MTNRLRTVFVILLTAMLVLGFWRAVPPSQPTYQGKTLENWLEQFYDCQEEGPDYPEYKQAITAIRQIGTNAFPVLLNLMATPDSRLRQTVVKLSPDCFHMHSAFYQRMVGAHGFIAFGPAAQPAVPDLIALADNSDSEIRYPAIVALGHLDCAPREIIPALIKHLDDTRVQAEAAEGLGILHQEPEITIPALISNVGPSPAGWDNSYFAIWGLASFGEQARSAVPVLLKRLKADQDEHDQNPSLRQMITNAMKLIDPEAAVKAGMN